MFQSQTGKSPQKLAAVCPFFYSQICSQSDVSCRQFECASRACKHEVPVFSLLKLNRQNWHMFRLILFRFQVLQFPGQETES